MLTYTTLGVSLHQIDVPDENDGHLTPETTMSQFSNHHPDAFRHDDADVMNDAHEYDRQTFACAVRNLMENHGYTETELAALVIEAMPIAEEIDENPDYLSEGHSAHEMPF